MSLKIIKLLTLNLFPVPAKNLPFPPRSLLIIKIPSPAVTSRMLKKILNFLKSQLYQTKGAR
jgi:hypothetical protein